MEGFDGEHTFAYSLLSAHLCAIFNGVQGKVDLRDGLLLLDCANGIAHVRLLVNFLLVVLHAGQTVLSCLPGAVGVGRMWRTGSRGGDSVAKRRTNPESGDGARNEGRGSWLISAGQ